MRTLVAATMLFVTVLIFAPNTAGQTFTTIQVFGGSPNDGANPAAGVMVGARGVLYGTTTSGGGSHCRQGCGTAFYLTPPASSQGYWDETVFDFPGGAGGKLPLGFALSNDAVFYGVTAYGGNPSCNEGCGTVFSLRRQPQGGSLIKRVLYYFTGGTDGSTPAGVVASSDGVLYGTTDGATNACNSIPGCGTVFALKPPVTPDGSWTETTIYTFTGGSDGDSPSGNLAIGSGGVLYGTTADGAAHFGTVYSLTPPSSVGGNWTETTLHEFAGYPVDGANPHAGVTIGKDGALYGTTFYGGQSRCGGDGCGIVFSLTPSTSPGGSWAEAILHDFGTGSSDGAWPNSPIAVGNGGVLYGTSEGGGAGLGSVFSLTPPTSPGGAWTEVILHAFMGGSDGATPNGVAVSANGVLYGTTFYSGPSYLGTVFSLAP